MSDRGTSPKATRRGLFLAAGAALAALAAKALEILPKPRKTQATVPPWWPRKGPRGPVTENGARFTDGEWHVVTHYRDGNNLYLKGAQRPVWSERNPEKRA